MITARNRGRMGKHLVVKDADLIDIDFRPRCCNPLPAIVCEIFSNGIKSNKQLINQSIKPSVQHLSSLIQNGRFLFKPSITICSFFSFLITLCLILHHTILNIGNVFVFKIKMIWFITNKSYIVNKQIKRTIQMKKIEYPFKQDCNI